MRALFATMISFFVLNFWIIPYFTELLFPNVPDAYPIYTGMILLSGLIAACTIVVLEKIDEIQKG